MRALAALLLVAATAHADSLWDDVGASERRYRQLLEDARRARDDRDLGAAEGLLLAATRLSPDDPAAWRDLGEVRRIGRDWPGAREALERARSLSPDGDDPLLAFHLGFARAVSGDLEGALVEYRRAEGAGPRVDPELVQLDLGDVAMALGRLGEALIAYRRAVALNPRRALGRFALAVALDRDEQLARSARELEVALTLDRNLFSLRGLDGGGDQAFHPPSDRHYWIALAHLQRGRLAAGRAALRAFLAASQQGPWGPRARDRLAAVPVEVERRELSGTGYDRGAMVRVLSGLLADAERCLAPGPGVTVEVVITSHGVAGLGVAAGERPCLERVTAPARKILGGGASTSWPLARPLVPSEP